MDLIINNAVIHEVLKDVDSITSVRLSNRVLNNDSDNINLLLEKLNDVFNKRSPKLAKLKDDSSFRDSINSSNFLQETQTLIENLKEQLINLPQAKGGYFLFVEYKARNNFLAVFILRNTQGFITKNQENDYILEQVTHLEVDKLAMGMRINLDIYNDQDNEKEKQRYVSLIRGTTDISKYFGNWIGIDDVRLESRDANSLMQIANNIDIPAGIKNREELKRKIGEFASNAINNEVNLTAISLSLFQDESYLASYCDENNIDIDSEFKMSKANIRKFYSIIAKTDGINISFGREKINNSITIDNNKLIITSKTLVQEINSQINE